MSGPLALLLIVAFAAGVVTVVVAGDAALDWLADRIARDADWTWDETDTLPRMGRALGNEER